MMKSRKGKLYRFTDCRVEPGNDGGKGVPKN